LFWQHNKHFLRLSKNKEQKDRRTEKENGRKWKNKSLLCLLHMTTFK
jgi:hypothetical protein